MTSPDRLVTYLRRKFGRSPLLSSSAWAALGSVAAKGGAMLAMLISARMLDVSDFGYLALVYATLNQVVVLAGAGLGAGATAFVARAGTPAERGRVVRTCLGVSAVLAALSLLGVLAFAFGWANSIYGSDVDMAFAFGAPLVLAAILSGTASGVLAGFSAFRTLALVNVASGTVLVGGVAIGTKSGGIEGGIIAFSLGAICLAVATMISVRRSLGDEEAAEKVPRGLPSPLGRILRFAVPATVSALVVVPALFIANAVLIREAGASQMAVFAVALQWQAIVMLPQTAINPALLSHLAHASTAAGSAEYWRRFRSTLRLAASASGIPAVVLAVSAPLVLSIYGAEYAANWEVLALLSVSGLLAVISSVIGNVIITAASMWWAALLNGLWALSFLAQLWVLVPRYGAVGLATAHVGSYALHAVLCLGFLAAMRRVLRSRRENPRESRACL